MSAPLLRPYQNDILQDVRGALRQHRSVVLQAPTGAGKSVMIASMFQGAASRGLSGWLVCHRTELIEQLSAKLWECDVPHGVIAGGRSQTPELVQVASIQTLARRLGTLRAPDFLAIDECHHAAAASYRAVIEHCAESWIIGLTATPERLDGRGLGEFFEAIVLGPSVEWLIEQGFLAPFRVYAPAGQALDLSGVRSRAGDYVREELARVVDQSAIVGNAVDHYMKFVHPRTCLVYCVSRKHARHVTDAYRARGIDARYCGGDTPDVERRRIVSGLRRGTPPVVVSVDLFGEGLDAPGLAAVQLLRPTQSLALHLQQIGRALRVEPGKDHAIVLDHVGNCHRHGFPTDPREWTLEGRRKRRKKSEEEEGPAIQHCGRCFAVYRANADRCPVCGLAHPVVKREGPKEVDGELAEVDLDYRRKILKLEEVRAQSLEDWIAIARRRGHKPAWAGIRYAVRAGVSQQTAIAEARRLWNEQESAA